MANYQHQCGEFIRTFGNTLRARKEEVSHQVGGLEAKNNFEGEGEVQEIIDMVILLLAYHVSFMDLPCQERPDHRSRTVATTGVVGCVTALIFQ